MQISFIKLSGLGDVIALVTYERHRTIMEVAGIMYSEEYRARVFSCKAIVMRPPIDIPIVKIKKQERKFLPVIERFIFIPLYILYSKKFKIKLSANINFSVQDLHRISTGGQEFLNFVREEEMKDFIIKSPAILSTPTDKIYFRTPSQEYSKHFLRVGNIQGSRHVLDIIFFWTLPYLKDTGAILTDSWSISSTTFNISRLLARYAGENIKEALHVINNFHVNMLSTHYHGLREMDKETRETLAPLQYKNKKGILFIISAVKTKRSLVNIEKAVKAAGFSDNVNYLGLYQLTEGTGVECLCTLNEDFCKSNKISFKSFKEPPIDATVLPIDEQSFFPLDCRDKLIGIQKKIADISKQFFETYGGKGIISLHRQAFFDNSAPLRHHGIYIDISPMLKCKEFIEKMDAEISKIQKLPSCIIYPPHTQGHEMVNIISEKLQQKFGGICEIFCFSTLDILPKEHEQKIKKFLTQLAETDIVLVVDDVSITGDRLHTYQKILYFNNYRGKIRYLVGVARPESEQLWDERKKILRINGSTLDNIEMLIIPDWNQSNCPWCQEKEKLKEVLDNKDYQGLKVTEQLELRLNDLNRAEKKGLTDNVFFKLGKPAKPLFRGGSVFCTISTITEADLATCIASSIQHLRNGIIMDDSSIYTLSTIHPVYSILNPSDFLDGDRKFFEPLIKACILRVSKNRELYATEDKNRQDQKKFILSFLNGLHLPDEERTFFIYELYLAMKLGKIPKPNMTEHLREVLENYFTTGKALPLEKGKTTIEG